MSRRFYFTFAILGLICLLASLWQGYEVTQLGGRLQRIDEKTQRERLLQLSLPRVEEKLHELLAPEIARLGEAPRVGIPLYPVNLEGKSDFVTCYFMQTPANLFIAEGQRDEGIALTQDPQLIDTIRRKAYNPNAPLFDPNENHQLSGGDQKAVFGVYEVFETDFTKEIKQTDKASPYFGWSDGKQLVYMRRIPTTHGYTAEGMLINWDLLREKLMPSIEPELKDASLALPRRDVATNISTLPLSLDAGESILMPDSPQREEAIRSALISAWLFCASSVVLIFALFAFFTRYERRRSDLIAAVTHELRTPLTSMSLSTEMLKEGLIPPDKIKEYHGNLHRESLRLSHLVENILAFARINRVKRGGRPDHGRCEELLPPLLDKMKRHLEQAGFQCSYQIDRRCQLLQLKTDLILLEQILTNLADNSIKYGRGEKAIVNIQVQQQRRTIIIRFSDKGAGLDDHIKNHIFVPFKRAQESEGKPGVGLGLALSRSLARALGGELTLEHSDSQGCSFIISLPTGD
ncbi:MAG: HAMP domain-containing sensor histidine kinase [Akkermansia sp.]